MVKKVDARTPLEAVNRALLPVSQDSCRAKC